MHQKLVFGVAFCALGLGAVGCAPVVAPAPVPPAPIARPAAPPSQPIRPSAQPTASDELPDGPGKAETLAACGGCHGIGQITGQHHDAAQWSGIVTTMINNGAPVADADFNKVVSYLAAHFGP